MGNFEDLKINSKNKEGCAGCDPLYVPRLCELVNSANDPNNVCFMVKPEAEALSQYYTSVGCMEVNHSSFF